MNSGLRHGVTSLDVMTSREECPGILSSRRSPVAVSSHPNACWICPVGSYRIRHPSLG